MNIPLNKFYDIVFITTFVDNEYISKYITSVIESNYKTNVLLIIICQKGLDIKNIESEYTTIVKIKVDNIISISAARNLGINYILNNGIKAEYIMFPDDDSTYSKSFFENYQLIDKSNNYIIDVLCTGSNKLFIRQKCKDNSVLSSKNWNSACSVNLMIKFEYINHVGFFDINLGVGAKYGSAEDNDYYIRVSNISSFIYTKQLYNFHPSPSQTYKALTLKKLIFRFNNYGKGIIYCLCKHYKYKDALFVCIRSIGGGVIAFFKGNFKKSIAYFCSFYSRFTLLFLLYTNLNRIKR